ncbi:MULTISPECIES: hypothetical protein [unclassified Caulobacter]|uniref:hypothetical protein n=1 Tax=unclassified Caulobacter TaxID=2648921 RepID=UPI000D36D0AE|nr:MULTISPECIES: hypothetical protein [unclassified Caulobacter]PTS89394.1 hypothetical protein DBR21_06555 [Caulobacter sp. HMWF009]PTT04484.1 hypothetical protein DBR10_18670 [Caulobacter sp. HMWF025]
MKTVVLMSALMLAAGGPAAAQSAPPIARVTVEISPDLARNTDTLDAREFDYLKRELTRVVEKKLKAKGAMPVEGGTLALVIEDATPNRPTQRQMSLKPGLSYSSFGVGGARISGEYRDPSGATTPIRYGWYETDIRRTPDYGTWTDADRAFGRLADKVAKGELN